MKSGAERSIFTCPEPPSQIESWSECEALGTSCTNHIVLDDTCNLEYDNGHGGFANHMNRRDMLLSWDVLNKISSSSSNQNDKNFEAKRLLCVIYTYHKNIEKARAIDATW